MITDPLPRDGKRLAEYRESDRLTTLEVPPDSRLRDWARRIEHAMEDAQLHPVQEACAGFLACAAGFYMIDAPGVRVLAARPVRVYEGGSSELFGDYDLRTAAIRVWMRTAVRKKVTSYGTFLSTLTHEFCHHLDRRRFGFADTPHTRGFYERAAILYHESRGTPRKRLFWTAFGANRWRIDWPRTNRGA